MYKLYSVLTIIIICTAFKSENLKDVYVTFINNYFVFVNNVFYYVYFHSFLLVLL